MDVNFFTLSNKNQAFIIKQWKLNAFVHTRNLRVCNTGENSYQDYKKQTITSQPIVFKRLIIFYIFFNFHYWHPNLLGCSNILQSHTQSYPQKQWIKCCRPLNIGKSKKRTKMRRFNTAKFAINLCNEIKASKYWLRTEQMNWNVAFQRQKVLTLATLVIKIAPRCQTTIVPP